MSYRACPPLLGFDGLLGLAGAGVLGRGELVPAPVVVAGGVAVLFDAVFWFIPYPNTRMSTITTNTAPAIHPQAAFALPRRSSPGVRKSRSRGSDMGACLRF